MNGCSCEDVLRFVLPRAVFVIGKGCVVCEVGTNAKEKRNILGLPLKLDTPIDNTQCLSLFYVHIVIGCRSVARKRSRISLRCAFCKL